MTKFDIDPTLLQILSDNEYAHSLHTQRLEQMTQGFLLLIGLDATLVYVYWAVRNDERADGQPVAGLFAYLPGREPPSVQGRHKK